MGIESLIFRILPFLFSALRRAFEKRNHGEQMAMINGVTMAQILRNKHQEGFQAVIDEAGARLGQDPLAVEDLLYELAERRGWEVTSAKEVPQYIKIRTDLLRSQATLDGFWHGVAGELVIIIATWTVMTDDSVTLESEKLGWPDLAAGLLEFAFRKYVKGKF